jgi:hypothetical protein
LAAEKRTTIPNAPQMTGPEALALRLNQNLRAMSSLLVARPLQSSLASGRAARWPHYRTAFRLSQVAQSSDFEFSLFTSQSGLPTTRSGDIRRDWGCK